MRIIRKTFLWLLILICFFIVQGLFLIYLYEDDIKQAALKKLNEQLNTEIKVGRIDLSLFDNFPFVSLTFPDVNIRSTLKDEPYSLLEARKVSMLFNLFDLYFKNYRIRTARIEDGELYIKVNRNGEDNYHIWKTSSSSGETVFSLSIKDIELENVRVHYVDDQLDQQYNFLAKNVHLSGNFTDKEYDLSLAGDLNAALVRIDTITYLKDRDLNASLVLNINTSQNRYTFKKGELQLRDLALLVQGSVSNRSGMSVLDLSVQGRNLTVQSLLNIVPSEFTRYLSGYHSKGDMSFNAIIKGQLSESLSPGVIIDFSVKNGEITSDKLGKTFKNVQIQAIYTNGTRHSLGSSSLHVKKLSAKMDDNPFTASLSITDFNMPFMDLRLDGTIGLSGLFGFLENSKVRNAGGSVAINATYRGLITDFKDRSRISKTSASGTIKLSACHFAIENSPLSFENLNGNFSISNNTLEVRNFSGVISSSDFLFNGSFINLLPFILGDTEPVIIDAALTSKRFNLDELLLVSAASQTDDSVYRFRISPRISCRFKTSFEQFSFRRFTATNVNGVFAINNQVLQTDFLALNAMDGQIYIKGSIDASRKSLVNIKAESSIQKVNIRQLFYQCENFGQEVLVDKNLNGRLSAKMQLSSLWKEDLSIYQDQVKVKSAVLIEDGQLINFEPMMALSKFVHVNELKNLRFSALQNEIEIRDRKIVIPAMEIQSNALNLTLSGTHDFDNRIDYQLKILLSELISKKLKSRGDDEFGVVEDDGSGKTALYLRMTGLASDPVFTLDKKAVKQKIALDLQNERKEVKQVLKDEFEGWFSKDKQLNNVGEEGAADWEKDIPQPKRGAKPEVTAEVKELKDPNKKGWQKIKEKLNEPLEE